jgi:ATP-dependent DNA helicase UvrD/PcrA
MERIEVVEQSAAALLSAHVAGANIPFGSARVEQLCKALSLELQSVPAGDVMLGGAYSRLQLWAWEQPELGGMIWLSRELDAQTRTFAVAHELGHFVLHRGERISVHRACNAQEVNQQADPGGLRTEDHQVEEYTPRARRELEANAFAAELLAPRTEVRHLFASDPHADLAGVATHFCISLLLAQRRLIDAVLASTRPAATLLATAADHSERQPSEAPVDLIEQLDPWQRDAARAAGPALVVAGPGTGKTATLIGRVAHLVAEQRVPPEKTLALTFSNRAAGEMRARLDRSGLPGERMPIMTIHAFAASLLREYASHVPHAPDGAELKPDFRILDEADSFLLMEELLGVLPLHYYRSLGNPTAHLRTLLADFSRARDGLLTPADYLELVDGMPLMQPPGDETSDAVETSKAGGGTKKSTPLPEPGTYAAEQIARARERAEAYGVWDRELRRRGLVDFGGLIQRAVELLHSDPAVLAEVRRRYLHVLVDEFQDTNRAAAEFLMLVAGVTGSGLWVVGDRNQSIYRFRGAAPSNLPRLVERYPALRVLTLRQCYRSVPDIVRLGSAMAARMAEQTANVVADTGSGTLAEALQPVELQPVRHHGAHPAIRRGDTFADATHERLGLAEAIQAHRALGHAYADQAVLCRTHKQVRQIAAILTSTGVPVSQLGDFFDRPEVKDTLMLLWLAAGPDARGVLRARPLLTALGYPSPASGELAAAARALAAKRQPLPLALCRGAALADVAGLSATMRQALTALGAVAMQLRDGSSVGARLADFLLRPRGYAWRLLRRVDGCEVPLRGQVGENLSPAQAQQALAALGELVRLALRFDVRWAREPDFRARLSRAVTHRRAAPLAAADALESAPGADATPEPFPAEQRQTADAMADRTPTAPAVRCFLHYLTALRAADVPVPVPAGETNAVQVLTLHQSKGLEFPIVYLPGLAQGEFPRASGGRDEVCPPGFRESDAPGDDDAAERCLFYVGVTRARDVVALTRAASYRRSRTGTGQRAAPSALLALLDDSDDWQHAAPLLSDAELERLALAAAALDVAGDEDARDEDDAKAEMLPIATGAAAHKPTFRLHELEQYLACPQEYRYAHGYGLLDPTQDAVYRFHRFVRRGAKVLRDVHAAVPGANWPTAEAQLQALWETDGPAGHAYERFYWQAAEAILREEWQAITAPDGEATSGRVLLAQPLCAELRHCIVEVTADRVIVEPVAGDPSAPPLTVLVRLHTGRPRQEDQHDLTLALYYLAHQQQHPGAPVQIALAYAGTRLADAAAHPHELAPGELIDVTDVARRDAEKYLKVERKQRSKLDKLDEAAAGITAGRYAPRPDEHRCPTCPYCYVCPADPDTADAMPTVAVPQVPASAESRS